MHMGQSHVKHTPAEKDPTHKDLQGALFCEDWDYRSVVGMLLYLEGSTHPDISYAVHQCA